MIYDEGSYCFHSNIQNGKFSEFINKLLPSHLRPNVSQKKPAANWGNNRNRPSTDKIMNFTICLLLQAANSQVNFLLLVLL